jgi:hypothetical protein
MLYFVTICYNLAMENVRILDSARKHGISDEDILHALEHYSDYFTINENDKKVIYIGYDVLMRDLEMITVEKYDDIILVIHAMKLRKSTALWFEERKHGK